ncbi:apolipoprotein A-II [Sebastes umbrosus]|uniref:apolipoprotein A-II n=1 Tax=Sebastes umbrosus TaxID=72105 RepID=UPI00189D1CAB|nr:apolipoprotein A-II [Sebastes umbrosus]
MNAKYALALILSLQVSMSLCELPTPSAELDAKVQGLQAVLFKRFLNGWTKMQAAIAPMVEDSARGAEAKTYVEDIFAKPEVQAIFKVAGGIGEEAGPLVDKARTTVLGLYEQYARAHIGTFLDDRINNIKFALDRILPAE